MTRSNRADFINWVLTLPDVAAFVVETDSGRAHCSPVLQRFLTGHDAKLGTPPLATAELAAAAGRTAFEGEVLRRAAVASGPHGQPGSRQLWATVPIESDSGDVLLLGLYVGPLQGADATVQEAAFRAAMQEPDRRHGINQPLTAMSFLLENLLHAFVTAAPDAVYRARKAGDLGLQLIQLRALLPVDSPPK